MRNFFVAKLLLIFLVMLSGCAEKPADQTARVLDGEWAVRSIKGKDVATTPEDVEGMKWQITGDMVLATQPDGATGKMKIRLDHEKKSIDITSIEGGCGNRVGETDLGIFSLENDRLRICVSEPIAGSSRPNAFAANQDSWIMELQRVSP